MIAHILITCPKSSNKFSAALCVLKSIRIGFPTAKIIIHINGEVYFEFISEVSAYSFLSSREQLYVKYYRERVTHDQHIDAILTTADNEPIVFIDPDIIFYSNVEEQLKSVEKLVAGRLVPYYWNAVVEANEVSRVHTSLLYIKNPSLLNSKLKSIVQKENFPFHPYAPFITYLAEKKFFYDTFANISHFIGLENINNFSEDMLDSYTHLVSGSMLDTVCPKLVSGERLSLRHKLAETSPEKVRGVWREDNIFYANNPPRL